VGIFSIVNILSKHLKAIVFIIQNKLNISLY